MINESKTLYS